MNLERPLDAKPKSPRDRQRLRRHSFPPHSTSADPVGSHDTPTYHSGPASNGAHNDDDQPLMNVAAFRAMFSPQQPDRAASNATASDAEAGDFDHEM